MSFFLPWFLLKALCKKLRVKVLPRRPLIHVSGEVEQDQDLDAALKAIAAYIRSRNCGSICLMIGAGVSTAAGVPDFRSDRGVYANAEKYNLPYPEAIFDINYFKSDPRPFYSLAHDLLPLDTTIRPTLTHSFISILHKKRLLSMCLTQNVDSLELRAGVPPSRLLEAHGTFRTARCAVCKKPYDGKRWKEDVREERIPKCDNVKCGGTVKPDVVLFGEQLPTSFFTKLPSLWATDLLLIIGTSLIVQPFASLAHQVQEEACPRILINQDPAPSRAVFGGRAADVSLLGNCDEVVRRLCRELGWEEELDRMWRATQS
ncbi:DHS-like NAD/FAD-binding domain-containing protein [Stereum hirsutum FP-91666 SS1]|uniref:DHS-like NAD/FAD-binding domain-containing protein n=1 Tax=Stereum hirsutum (strain FP-91666) TaxID=721885 RepID=UPI0004449406|nr:DHS-like NAD/FAD-binding domain-containing protein [Stereum hirsutum FP-91666 SS1]EIM86282.1 DHS-like NAD/FAD-binding domain-containing protein [Stereum hirsutum FP-91666 SS1]